MQGLPSRSFSPSRELKVYHEVSRAPYRQVQEGGWCARAIQFPIFPSLPESSTPSPLAGGEGWDGGEKHGLGTPPACTPTIALPLAQGEGKDRQARVRKLNGPAGAQGCLTKI